MRHGLGMVRTPNPPRLPVKSQDLTCSDWSRRESADLRAADSAAPPRSVPRRAQADLAGGSGRPQPPAVLAELASRKASYVDRPMGLS
jgi:hypothetical protein